MPLNGPAKLWRPAPWPDPAPRGIRGLETKMIYARINAKGEAQFIKWLRTVLKSPQYAEKYAEALLDDLDCSDPDIRTLSIEVRDFHTRTRHPESYRFDPDEYDVIEIDEDGSDIEG